MGNDQHGPAYPEPPYVCPICRGDKDRFSRCEYPGCPDGHDQPGRFRTYPTEHSDMAYIDMRSFFIGLAMFAALALAIIFFFAKPAHAFDHGFDPFAPTSQWMESLQRRPPAPVGPCCGVADAYQADIYTRNPDGSYDIVITDGSPIMFPDGAHRDAIPDGTAIHVPENKVNPPKEQAGNPTGHAWLFMSVYGITTNGVYKQAPGSLYCFVPRPEGS